MKVTMLVKLLLTSKRLLTQLGGGGGGGVGGGGGGRSIFRWTRNEDFQYGISRFWKNMVGKRYFQH